MKNIVFIYLVFLGFGACQSLNDEKRQVDNNEMVGFESNNLLSPLFFSEPNLFNISFPLWFVKEAVEKLGIDSVYLEVFVVNWPSGESANEESDYSFTYAFKPNGQLNKSTFTDYYELTTLVEATFDYSKLKTDSFGYYPPRIEKTTNLLIGTNPTKLLRAVSDLQRFNRLELLRHDEGVVVFKNTTSPALENHMFILNEEHQNILFVDDLVTNPEDVFYYGSPTHYTKVFSLTNLVREDLRAEVVLFEKRSLPKSKRIQTNDITTKTLFNYDEKGRWIGHQDSLMLNSGQFIKLSDTKIVYNEQGLPARVDIAIGSDKNDMRLSKTIKLNYAIKKL